MAAIRCEQKHCGQAKRRGSMPAQQPEPSPTQPSTSPPGLLGGRDQRRLRIGALIDALPDDAAQSDTTAGNKEAATNSEANSSISTAANTDASAKAEALTQATDAAALPAPPLTAANNSRNGSRNNSNRRRAFRAHRRINRTDLGAGGHTAGAGQRWRQ